MPIARQKAYNFASRNSGEVPEWSNGPHSKCVVPLTGDRGFDRSAQQIRTHAVRPAGVRERSERINPARDATVIPIGIERSFGINPAPSLDGSWRTV